MLAVKTQDVAAALAELALVAPVLCLTNGVATPINAMLQRAAADAARRGVAPIMMRRMCAGA